MSSKMCYWISISLVYRWKFVLIINNVPTSITMPPLCKSQLWHEGYSIVHEGCEWFASTLATWQSLSIFVYLIHWKFLGFKKFDFQAHAYDVPDYNYLVSSFALYRVILIIALPFANSFIGFKSKLFDIFFSIWTNCFNLLFSLRMAPRQNSPSWYPNFYHDIPKANWRGSYNHNHGATIWRI